MLGSFAQVTRATVRYALAAFVSAMTVAAAPAAGQVPASSATRPMTFLDTRHLRQVGAPTPSPDGRWLLYTLSSAGLEGGEAPDRPLSRVGASRASASTRQMTFTKDKNETSPRWSRDGSFFVVRLQPRGAGDRRHAQPALRDARRRRRGAAHHRRQGRRRTTSRSAATAGGSSTAAARRARSSFTACPVAGIDSAEARAAHHGIRPASARGQSRRTAGASTSSPPTRSIADEKARREKKFTVNIRNAGDADVEPVGAWTSMPRSDDAADRRRAYTVGRLHDLRRQQVGRLPRPIAANRYKREHHRAEHQRRSLPARGRHAAQIERLTNNARSRREPTQLLAGQQVDRVLRRRTTSTQYSDEEHARLPPRASATRRPVPQARQRRSTATSSVGFWSKDGGRSTSTRASGRRTSPRARRRDEHRAPADAREGVAHRSIEDEDSRRAAHQLRRPPTPPTLFTVDVDRAR